MPSLSFEKATGISTKLDTKLERIKRAFDLFDTDGNGSLSNEELRAVLTRPGGGSPLTEEDVAALIAEFDVNGDGELQIDEFAVFWGPMIEEEEEEASFIKTAAAGSQPRKGNHEKGPRKAKSPAKSPSKSPAKSAKAKGAKVAGASVNPSSDASDAFTPNEDDVEPLLQPASELEALVEEEAKVLADLEARITAGTLDSFERRLGAALLEEEVAKKALMGSKSALLDLVRSWDRTGDGKVNKVELRQAVRGTLKVNATNVEIDELFEAFDADNSGKLDYDELGVCLRALQDSAAAARNELAGLASLADEARARLEPLRQAAEVMSRVEAERAKQAKLAAEMVNNEIKIPLKIRVGQHLKKKKIPLMRAVKDFPSQAPEGYANREAFFEGIRAYHLPPPAVEDAELGKWFEEAMAECIAAAVSRPGGGVKLQPVLSEALSEATNSPEARAVENTRKYLGELRRTALAQQKAIKETQEEQRQQRREREAAMRAATEAKQKAEEEARQAKMRSFKRRKNVKDEEKKEFMQRVASKRAVRGNLADPFSRTPFLDALKERKGEAEEEEAIW